MKQSTLRVAALAGIAFAAGFAVARSPVAVRAQAGYGPIPVVAMSPTFVPDVTKLPTQPAPSCFPNARIATISKSSIATVQYAVGTLPAHYHTTANEIQYVIAGSGTEQFGSTTVTLQPGALLVIPPHTVHSGMKPVGNMNLKLLVIKVPQQRAKPDDNFIGTPPPSHC
jgi:mannose-6-phosphate isomerase-like protein (cupin superfamily)